MSFNSLLVILLQYMFHPFRCAWDLSKKMYEGVLKQKKIVWNTCLNLSDLCGMNVIRVPDNDLMSVEVKKETIF